MLGPARFRFLNRTRDLDFPGAWNDPDIEKLWLYNLHYLEDLLSEQTPERTGWHRGLIEKWASGNAPFSGNGWEPYPLSLRITNLVKWSLKGNSMQDHWLRSLALQSEYLYHRVEWHLLGNHLLENARALVLAGSFFEGRHADRWREKGRCILDKQMGEQILPDGGHFERSPMYHALVLEGLLDLIQVSEHYGLNKEHSCDWRNAAGGMVCWLKAMTHPDGEIAFFNDAAVSVALPPSSLMDFGRRLGVDARGGSEGEGVTFLESSGYIRMERGAMVALMDTAPLGPDHLPGHGHADTLSFELSVDDRRLLVNSGTGVYGVSEERLRQRGTAAHNTVVVDGENSSEVWGGFRVARRARPFGVMIRGHGDVWQVCASHDGYRRLRGKVMHTRNWRMTDRSLIVEDELAGRWSRAVAYFHFHPDLELELDGDEGSARIGGDRWIRIVITRGTGRVGTSTHHPEFGLALENPCLEVSLDNGLSCVEFHVIR